MEDDNGHLLGLKIKALKSDMDCDENDQVRKIPVGTRGSISRLNHIDITGERHYDIFWDNGAWTVYSEFEVQNDLVLAEAK